MSMLGLSSLMLRNVGYGGDLRRGYGDLIWLGHTTVYLTQLACRCTWLQVVLY